MKLAEVAERVDIDPPALARLATGKMLNVALAALEKSAETLGPSLDVDVSFGHGTRQLVSSRTTLYNANRRPGTGQCNSAGSTGTATILASVEIMKQKKNQKAYWEMTTAELREATKQFDQEFVAEASRPLTPPEQALWETVKAKSPATANGKAAETITIRLEKRLLKRCTALAKKKRLSRDALIARGLRALLAAERK